MSTSNDIVIENQRPGTPESQWGLANGPSAAIEGFATSISVNAGEQIEFKIDTVSTDYKIEIYRLGWYGGDGARLVATIDHAAGSPVAQPDPLVDLSTGLVDAGNWSVTDTWHTPADAVSGIYLAKLIRQDGAQGENYIPFIVRDDSSTSDIVYQTADSSWQAYNTWGGANLYQSSLDNVHLGDPASPDRAYAVSYNRPLANTALLNAGIFGQEYAAIRWLEKNGFDVTYQTGVDTAMHGDLLLNHKVFMDAGHDEYWSGEQRDNVEAARDAGVSLAFLSGNEVYWKTRWEPSIDGSGTEFRTLVCYKESWDGQKIDPSSEWTGLWRDAASPDGAQPENSLTGTLFMVNGNLSSMTVPYEFSKFNIWDNTHVANLQPGQSASFYGLLGYEWDVDANNASRPAGLINLSSTTVQVSKLVIGDNDLQLGSGVATHSLTLYRASSGALVFGAGSIFFPWALDSHHQGIDRTDPAIQQMMVNLFAQMGVEAGSLQSNLVPGVKSTDHVAPVESSLTLSGLPIIGSPMVITGTSADLGGGVVASTEISTDGGLTWHEANGFERWSYTWVPSKLGATTILARSVDDSLNLGTPISLNVTVSNTVGVAENTNYVTTAFVNPVSGTLSSPDGGPSSQNVIQVDTTPPSVSIVGGADAALFAVDEATNELSFLKAPDFEHPADANLDNLYEVVVQITEGSSSRLLPYVVRVTNVSPETILASASGNFVLASSDKEAFVGGAESDTVSYASAKSPVTVNLGAPNLNKGEAANDSYTSIENLIGSAFNDGITGDGGPNVIEGGAGKDRLDGGAGSDTVSYAHAIAGSNGVGVTVDLSKTKSQNTIAAGYDTLLRFENVIGSEFRDTLRGNSAANILIGLGGNDTLDGLGGGDTMLGGLGDDTYVVDNRDDVIDEASGGGGVDTILSSISFRLWDATHVLGNVENLTLTGTASIFATGNTLDNILIGNSGANILTGLGGNDILDGGAGADTMFGGTGDDTYVVDNKGDIADEASGGGGVDTVRSSIGFSLSDATRVFGDVENLTLTGTASIFATGNALDNVLIGNLAANTLSGLGGNDTLDGGPGADRMIGGTGDDIYIADNAGDIVDEAAGGGGVDTVRSSISFSLGNGTRVFGDVENLTLIGAAMISATGNALDNVLIGNSAANTLSGLGGNDKLDGGSGADRMIGGTGDDTYVVDNRDDVIDEASGGGGVDTILSSISFRLWDATHVLGNVENLTLTGTASIFATGNTLDNILIGNSGANILTGLGGNDILDGGAGADTMFGGTGDDTYIVDNSEDVVDEATGGGGTDTIITSVTFSLNDQLHALGSIENLTLVGTGSITGTGNDQNNVITGNAADNVLVGLAGNDTLIGGSGRDQFVYFSAAEGGDTIQDFSITDDTLVFSASGFGGGLSEGQQIVDGITFIADTSPIAASDLGTFLYDTATRDLYWDADGSDGIGGVHIAHFTTAVNLSADHFNIMA